MVPGTRGLRMIGLVARETDAFGMRNVTTRENEGATSYECSANHTQKRKLPDSGQMSAAVNRKAPSTLFPYHTKMSPESDAGEGAHGAPPDLRYFI
jgi:hypothetical protein